MQIGLEELVVFKVLSRATHPTHPEILAKSIFAYSTLPGRVYAEVSTLDQAINLAAAIQQLSVNAVRLVPAEEMLARLQVPNPYSFQPQSWARIRGTGKGWGVYCGDVALVAEVNHQSSVVVVPRVSHYTTKSRTRPEQALRPPFVLRSVFGSELVSEVANRHLVTFRGQSFTPEGFLVSPLSGVDLMRPQDDLPSKELLNIFRQCPSLFEDTYLKASARLSSLQIKTGDRVKIVRGEYRGIFGRVTRVDEKAVAVYMESQDLEEDILVDSVRRVFRIGDQVTILCGTHAGSTGWVVAVLQGSVKVFNVEKGFEVCNFNCRSSSLTYGRSRSQ
jgi:transcription elongation factor SPT5